MAGVRSKALKSGKYQGFFVDYCGKMKFFVGTRKKSETFSIAKRLEDDHRQIRLGYRPKPHASIRHKNASFQQITNEYLAWGNMQGGRGGRPWGKEHARKKKAHIKFWETKLQLKVLSDLDGVLPKFEIVLQELKEQNKAGRTIRHIADALTTFCNWCCQRDYLAENPLLKLGRIDCSPKEKRRAMTINEIHRLLAVAPEHMRLLYEVALCTGLRADELRSLTIAHLDIENCGLWLEAEWTKNRKATFQPIGQDLLLQLIEFFESGIVSILYQQYYRGLNPPSNALLYVPSHTAREMDRDLKAAGIPKRTIEGKLDFHASRTSYITLCAEKGGNVKEIQTMARHSTPYLTLNVYTKTRNERLSELAEKVTKAVLSRSDIVHSLHSKQIQSKVVSRNHFKNKILNTKKVQWRRGDSNPRPEMFRDKLLHA
jgi:integrase